MYIKSITRTKNGWRCKILTSEDGMCYTTLENPTLSDMIESIDGTIKDYVEWKIQKGHDNTIRGEKQELKF